MTHLALLGTTASGKSALALAMGRAHTDLEIVSVDSMQVYRGMDIGTAKPSLAERKEVPHHLIDIADPGEEFTVARFKKSFDGVIRSIEERGNRALLVGGTGLYVRAVIDDLAIPGQFPESRSELEAEPDTLALHRRLAELDPVAAARTEPANRRRIIRALEVSIGSGRPFSSFGPGLETYPPTRFRLAATWLPRDVVSDRIATRMEAMVAAGFVDEVRVLAARPFARTARQALGYREVLRHVEQGASLEAELAEAVRRTRAFARRQRVWFRRDPRITWFGTPTAPTLLAASLIAWAAPRPG